MFHLRAYVGPKQVDDVSRALRDREGVRHIVLSGVTADSGAALITAELDDDAADEAIESVDVRPGYLAYMSVAGAATLGLQALAQRRRG